MKGIYNMGQKRGDSGVGSVRLALDVLETIAYSGEELGVTQVALRVRATKSSVHRHLLTLVERGYLKQNVATSRYGMGVKSHLLARLGLNIDLAKAAEGPMRELRDALGHTVVLSSMTPRGALVISTISSRSSIEIGVRPGSELSFHASAQGKVLLAFAPRSLQDRVLGLPLQSFTSETVENRNKVERELAGIIKCNYATAPEQTLLGINAVAAPIFDETDTCIAAIAIVGSIQLLPKRVDKVTVAALKASSQHISRKLVHGHSGIATHSTRPSIM